MSKRRTSRVRVTKENSKFDYVAGMVLCPISTNKWTDDEFFIIDIPNFSLVEGRCWSVNNDMSHLGKNHYSLRAGVDGKPVKLHTHLFREESVISGLQVDHLLHWTDNRRSAVDFVTHEENASRGPALLHEGSRRLEQFRRVD